MRNYLHQRNLPDRANARWPAAPADPTRFRLLLLRLPLHRDVLEPVGAPGYPHDAAAVAYPVRYRAGGDLVPEGLRPSADADFRGDYRRALLVARADQLEQQVGAPFVDVQVAELVYDEELGVRVVLEPLLQDAPRPGVPQVVDEPRAVDELDLAARPRGLDPDGDREVGLPDAPGSPPAGRSPPAP